eukprot:jgi/Mesen1/5671/ME000288S04889
MGEEEEEEEEEEMVQRKGETRRNRLSRDLRARKGSVNPLVELPDDGYVWRKYGQKALNNTNIDRVYYWCAWRRESGCLARKWVDVACDDATHCLHVSIEGQHNHEERSAPKPRRGASHQRRVVPPAVPQRETCGRMRMEEAPRSNSSSMQCCAFPEEEEEEPPPPRRQLEGKTWQRRGEARHRFSARCIWLEAGLRQLAVMPTAFHTRVRPAQAEFDQLASHYGLGPEEMGAREIGQVTAAGVPEGSLHGVPAGPAWGPAQLSAGEQQKKRAWGAGDSSDSGLPGSLLESLLPLFKRGRLNPQQQPVVLGERDKERAADVSTAMLDSAAGAGGGAMAVGGVAGAASVGTMLPQFDTQLFPNLNLFQRNPQQQQQQGPQKQLGQGTDDGLLAFGGTGAGGHLSGFHRQGDARYALLDALLASLRQDPPAVHQESRFSMPIPACPRADEISPRSDPPLLMQDSCHIKTTPGAAVLPASYFQGEGQSMPPAAQFDQMRRPGTFAPAGAGARGGALAAPGPHGEGLTVQPLVFNPHEFSFTGALPSPSVARALQLLEANMLAPLGALQSQAELMEPGGTRAASVAPGDSRQIERGGII